MNRKRRAKLEKIYDLVPKIKCKGHCTHSCQELALSVDEVKNLHKISGKATKLENGQCNHLKEGKCSVYQDRPVLCRLWGVVESMRCPHGCEAERVLTEGEAKKIYTAVFKLSNGLWTDNR